MVNKSGKAPRSRASKRTQQQSAKPGDGIFQFAEGSIFAESQKFLQDTDAKPFRDFAYVTLAVLVFFVWRLFAAYGRKHDDAISIWSLFTWGAVAMINLWAFVMVMIRKKRGGDIVVAKIQDEDLLRAMWMTGIIGGWLSLIFNRYKLTDRSFMLKVVGVTAVNLLWFIIFGIKRIQYLQGQ